MTDKTDTDTPLTDALLRELASLCKSDERTIGLVYKSPIWEHARSLERQLAAARKDSERLDWLLSGYAICRWAAEDHSRNDEVLDSRQAIDAAIRRYLTPMEAERKFAQANKETGSTDEF